MDDWSKFLVGKIDKGFEGVRTELRATEDRIMAEIKANSKRIDALEIWQAKLMGMAFVAGGVGAWLKERILG